MAAAKPPAERVLVAYSGGKDSLVTVDLCCRAGAHVECFYMYLVPGLDHTEAICEYARKRWGVTVKCYQHFMVSYFMRRGVFRPLPDLTFPVITIKDIERRAREDSGLEWIGYGYKKIDSLQRRGWLNHDFPSGVNEKAKKFTLIADWNNTHVLAYLNRRRLHPVGASNEARSNGTDLTPHTLEWLRREWPADYRRVLEVFPFAENQADRADSIREWRKQFRKSRKAGAGADGPSVPDQSSPVQPAQTL